MLTRSHPMFQVRTFIDSMVYPGMLLWGVSSPVCALILEPFTVAERACPSMGAEMTLRRALHWRIGC